MAVVRKLSMMVEFKNNAESAMNQANRNMDKIKSSAIDAERSMQRAGQSAGRMGTQYQESSQKVKKNTDEMRNSADQTAKASEKIRQLDRQLELQKSALKASTAGLDDLGRKTASARIKASGLSEVYDLQRKKLSALHDKYNDMSIATNTSADAMHKMRVQINKETAELGQLQGKLALVNQEARHTRKTFISLMDKAGNFGTNYLVGVSAPIAYGMTQATKASLDFGQQMKLIQNEVEGSGLSAKQVSSIMKQVSSDSKKWSGEFGKSTDEVNEGMLDIVRDGYSAKEVMGTLPTMLAAARGSAENLKTVTVATTGTLEQFGQKSSNAGKTIASNNKITNGFMVIANKTKATIGDLGESFSIMGSTAKVNHQSIANMAAAIGELRSQGIDASTAGTSLRAGLVNMVKPTKAMRAAMKDMNLTVIDSKGNMKSLPNIIDQIRKGTEHMTSAQKNADLAALMGKESLSVWSDLVESGSGHLRHLSKAYDDAGNSAQRMSDKMNKTPLSKLQQFQSSVHNLGIDFGDKVLPTLKPTVDWLTKVVHGFDGMSSGMKHFTVGAGIFAAVGVPLLVWGGKAAATFMLIHDRMKLVSTASKRYRTDMFENAAATETFAAAENSAANAGAVVSGTGSASAKGKKGSFIKRLFKRGGASATAETVEDVAQNASRGGRALRVAGTGAKWLGRGVAGLGILASLTGLLGMTKGTAGSHIGDVLGSMGGTWGGAAGGAALGTMIMPGVGTAIGGGIGAAAGSLAGSSLGKWAGGKIQGAVSGSSSNKDPSRVLEKGAASAVSAYEAAQDKIDTKFKQMAASGSKYSEKMAKNINNAYDSIFANAEKSAISQEKSANKNLDWFVKNGFMTKKQAKDDMQILKDSHHSAIASAKSASKALKDINSDYYAAVKANTKEEEKQISNIKRTYTDKNGHLTREGQKLINSIERTYSANRTVIASKYADKREKVEKTLKNSVVNTASQSAIEQRIILGKLKEHSGKLSVQQASTIVKQARKARDGSVSAAREKYDSVLDKANKEYYGTGSISKKQYERIVKKARDQRDDAVSAANDQWHDTVSAAKSQAKGIVNQVDWQTGKVLQWYDKMGRGIASAWDWIKSIFSGTSEQGHLADNTKGARPTASTSAAPAKTAKDGYGTHGMVAAQYANGTSGHPGGDAIMGDGGKPELWFTPQGTAGISPAVPTLYKNMPAGTQVLNGDDTERMLGAKAYAKGTNGFWDSIGDFLGKGFNWIKNGASLAANHLLKKAGVSVGDLGDLTNLTKNTAIPAIKKLISGGISNLAHSSDLASFKGVKVSGDVKQWIAAGMKLAGVKGASWAKGLATIAQRESGGNPNAVNNWDSNAKAGHPSAGLMQMIKSTFLAHAVKGHTSWMNPIDQVASDVRYIQARYGGISRVPGLVSMAKGGKYVGYAKGTPGAGSWAERVFGKLKKKGDPDDGGNGSVGVVSNRPITINAPVTINIKVDGGDANVADNIGRQVRDEIEKVFKNLTTFVDPGVVN